MADYEKLGAFYLGRPWDADARTTRPEPLLYDSADLTTHAVCVGMTGSGKTGLCLGLLEEAAIDGIPAIAIDPKGDLGNLLLTFPELRPQDFRPWVDEAEARRDGLDADAFAAKLAERWRRGLADWDQSPARIGRFAAAVERTIYTPGSSAGAPVSILRSLTAPPGDLRADGDAFRERIVATASGLLALLGIDADPLRSREHILLAKLIEQAWSEGRGIDLESLVREIQSPPFEKVGAFDLDSFFPARDRTGFALALNNLLASPGFAAWREGEPLDVARLLWTPEGKPRLSIFSIAHLGDAERMFFVTLLLNEIVAWMRTQSGTASLRAILYMDEVAGYLPPVATPPSKAPMMTLLKQARAFGLGVVVATQNPVDLDYKALSNAGSWFLGRLQTERDKARVLEGLEGASNAAGQSFDRSRYEAILSGLSSRVFLLNNVHDDQPVVFQTRWTLSYLRGPLTRPQIQKLMADRSKSAATGGAAADTGARGGAGARGSGADAVPGSAAGGAGGATPVTTVHPVLPPEAGEAFLPWRGSRPPGAELLYKPALLGVARLHFVDAKSAVDLWRDEALLLPLSSSGEPAWETGEACAGGTPELESRPEAGARFASLPPEATRARSYAGWRKALAETLYRTRSLPLARCAALDLVSKPGESEGEFRIRVVQAMHEWRDREKEKLRKSYAARIGQLLERERRALQRVERESAQLKQQGYDTAISLGTSVLGVLFGRRLTRASTAARSIGRAARERSDVLAAQEDADVVRRQRAELEAELEAEVAKLAAAASDDAFPIETAHVRPRKSDIAVDPPRLVWVPWWVGADGAEAPGHSPT